MKADEFLQRYWTFFLGFEQDLLETERFVSFDPDNFDTFSVEYNRLYQAVCSEVDVLAKQLCCLLGNKNSDTINQYYLPIVSAYPCILSETVDVKGLGCLEPWAGWTDKAAPEWWKLYNKVKHSRTEICKNEQSRWKGKPFYKAATLQNVMMAVAALYILEFYTLLLICHRANAPKPEHGKTEYNKLKPLFRCRSLHLQRWIECNSYFFGNEFIDERRIEALLEKHAICIPKLEPLGDLE